MKIQLLVALIIAVITGAYTASAQKITATLQLEGKTREFIVVRPTGSAPAGGFPLVFMLHGTSGDGEKFYSISKWKELGEQEKIVTVFPSSLEWCIVENGNEKRTTKWVCGDLFDEACPNQTFIDDELFIKKIIDTISKTITINPNKIYASGFSNGGNMTAKLSIGMSDIFASLCTSAGPLNALDTGKPKKHIPVWYTVGTHDELYIAAANRTSLPFSDSILYFLGPILNRFLNAYELTSDYTLDTTAISRTYTYKTSKPGAAPAYFMFTLFNNCTHEYPNGINYPIILANLQWEFYKKSALLLPNDVQEETTNSTSFLYPNPADDFITVNFPVVPTSQASSSRAFHIYNSMGTLVHLSEWSESGKINVSSLPNGVYIVRSNDQLSRFIIAR